MSLRRNSGFENEISPSRSKALLNVSAVENQDGVSIMINVPSSRTGPIDVIPNGSGFTLEERNRSFASILPNSSGRCLKSKEGEMNLQQKKTDSKLKRENSGILANRESTIKRTMSQTGKLNINQKKSDSKLKHNCNWVTYCKSSQTSLSRKNSASKIVRKHSSISLSAPRINKNVSITQALSKKPSNTSSNSIQGKHGSDSDTFHGSEKAESSVCSALREKHDNSMVSLTTYLMRCINQKQRSLNTKDASRLQYYTCNSDRYNTFNNVADSSLKSSDTLNSPAFRSIDNVPSCSHESDIDECNSYYFTCASAASHITDFDMEKSRSTTDSVHRSRSDTTIFTRNRNGGHLTRSWSAETVALAPPTTMAKIINYIKGLFKIF